MHIFALWIFGVFLLWLFVELYQQQVMPSMPLCECEANDGFKFWKFIGMTDRSKRWKIFIFALRQGCDTLCTRQIMYFNPLRLEWESMDSYFRYFVCVMDILYCTFVWMKCLHGYERSLRSHTWRRLHGQWCKTHFHCWCDICESLYLLTDAQNLLVGLGHKRIGS